MDWRLYHAIYDISLHHHWLGSFFNAVEKASIPFMVVATVALWFLARPGGDRKWKLAAGSGLGAAAVAVVSNQVIHAIWDRHVRTRRTGSAIPGRARPTPRSRAITRVRRSRSRSPCSRSIQWPERSSWWSHC